MQCKRSQEAANSHGAAHNNESDITNDLTADNKIDWRKRYTPRAHDKTAKHDAEISKAPV
ncbi:hypothetical protein SERLA73DRAFT_75230 [Serpula lacrymans var. lacrymans S7.3]|uniref:Uncharacterized protein n=1 Tax=Serpula lacrymans var. lacrymans (strain S7.3) TaxID=936435 RepID=F8Q304_SERL3|nr:hypothetical protein SERLA73DRAFT_75230 [Serpula lacrymans var. lacrymans S7.3]